jgi:hypothetical protein
MWVHLTQKYHKKVTYSAFPHTAMRGTSCSFHNKHRLFRDIRWSKRCFWRFVSSGTWRCITERCFLDFCTLKMKAIIYIETSRTVHSKKQHHHPVDPNTKDYSSKHESTNTNHYGSIQWPSIGTFLYLTVVPCHLRHAGLWFPSSRVQTRPKPLPSFGGEVKVSVPCPNFAACKRT